MKAPSRPGRQTSSAPPRPRLLLVLLVLLQASVAAVLLESLGRGQEWGAALAEDSYGYLLVARHFQGEAPSAEDAPLLRYRLFNPLLPALSALLGRALGIEAAFVLLNLLFWVLAVLAFHQLVRQWEGERAAWAGGVMLATSLPFIEWGLPVMLDAAAYCLAAGALLLYARFRRREAAAGVALGGMGALAVLVKPTLASLGAFLAAALWRDRRLGSALVVGALAAGVPIAFYLGIGLTVEDFFAFGSPRHRGTLYFLSAALFCFHWGWWLAWRGWRQGGSEDSTYLLYCAFFLLFFVPFVHSPRLFFLAYPAVLALAARGAAAVTSSPGRLGLGWLLVAWVATSNLLAAAHALVTRTLGIHTWSALTQELGRLW